MLNSNQASLDLGTGIDVGKHVISDFLLRCDGLIKFSANDMITGEVAAQVKL